MQSDWNNFCGKVILESFNMASRDEDNILDQIFESNDCLLTIFLYVTNTTVALKPNFMSSLCYLLYFFKYAFALLKFKTLVIKIPRCLLSILLV